MNKVKNELFYFLVEFAGDVKAQNSLYIQQKKKHLQSKDQIIETLPQGNPGLTAKFFVKTSARFKLEDHLPSHLDKKASKNIKNEL